MFSPYQSKNCTWIHWVSKKSTKIFKNETQKFLRNLQEFAEFGQTTEKYRKEFTAFFFNSVLEVVMIWPWNLIGRTEDWLLLIQWVICSMRAYRLSMRLCSKWLQIKLECAILLKLKYTFYYFHFCTIDIKVLKQGLWKESFAHVIYIHIQSTLLIFRMLSVCKSYSLTCKKSCRLIIHFIKDFLCFPRVICISLCLNAVLPTLLFDLR